VKTMECKDMKCPHHSGLKTRGRSFTGTVVAARMQNTATVEWERRKYIPKYERYLKLRTKIKVHNPQCVSAKKGDIVKITECKPLSKTKNFVIMNKVGEDVMFTETEAAREQAKVKKEKKEAKEAPKQEETEE